MKKKMNIAVVGLGNIGSYFYNYLKKNRTTLLNKTNTIPNILYVSARNLGKKRSFKIPKKLWLKNCMAATKMKNVDIIVELIGGSDGIAKKLVFEALKNKKHVITANKALVAKYGDRLAKIAEKNKVNFKVLKQMGKMEILFPSLKRLVHNFLRLIHLCIVFIKCYQTILI